MARQSKPADAMPTSAGQTQRCRCLRLKCTAERPLAGRRKPFEHSAEASTNA